MARSFDEETLAALVFEKDNPGRRWKPTFRRVDLQSDTIWDAREDEQEHYRRIVAPIVALLQ